MCQNVSLPPVDYAEQLMHNLRTVNDPGQDISSDTNIETAAMEDLPIDNNFLAREEDEIGEAAYQMNVRRIGGFLVDRSLRVLVPYAYDEIFSYMPRRADRPSDEPTEPHRTLINQWLQNVHSREIAFDGVDELGDRTLVPDHDLGFASMIRNSLPARLDWSSWIEKNGETDAGRRQF
jgi:hypothetical protein